MADYYAILKRAVDSLPDSTREQRRAVYDKARNALLKQLQGMNPPLPPSEISKQRVALEEAVRAVERDLMAQEEVSEPSSVPAPEPRPAAGKAPSVSVGPSVPAAPSAAERSAPSVHAGGAQSKSSVAPTVKAADVAPGSDAAGAELKSEDKVVRRAGQDVLKNAVRDAEKLGAATNAAVRSAQETADMVGDQRKGETARIEPTLGDAVVSNAKTYKTASPEASAGSSKSNGLAGSGNESEKSSKFGLFASIAVAAIVLGGSGYLLYQNKAEFLGQTGDAGQGSGSQTAGSDADQKKSDDEIVAKNVRTVTVKPEDVSAPDTTPEKAEQSESETAPASDVAQSQSNVGAEPLAGNQVAKAEDPGIQAIFYEENAGDGSEGQANSGETRWNLEGTGSDAVVSVSVEVPKRNIAFNIRLSKNQDASLPATHLIEIEVSGQNASDDLTISEIPGLIMKPTEDSRGQGLFGEPVRIADDLHWIALTASPKALRYNLELLELRQWVDMPILFKSGRRGILTIRKGESGATIVNDALRQWSK